jgi:histidine triad (HIT) family protein
MENCVFCRIAQGKAHASRVYEDEEVMAFLDARPVNEGHTLVVSKKHYENIFEIPDEELGNLFRIVKKVASAVLKSEKAEGIRIVQNNGIAAHQNIFHFHVHVIPEYEAQESHWHRITPQQGELDKVAAKIRRSI